MKEKLKVFFQNLHLREFMKRTFTKKRIGIAAAIIVILIALRICFSLFFEVEGIVKKVDGSNITVANFLYTKTVNVGDYPIAKNIQVGERIKISKSLSGDVLSVRGGFNNGGMMGKRAMRGNLKGKVIQGQGGFQNGPNIKRQIIEKR